MTKLFLVELTLDAGKCSPSAFETIVFLNLVFGQVLVFYIPFAEVLCLLESPWVTAVSYQILSFKSSIVFIQRVVAYFFSFSHFSLGWGLIL